MNKYKQSGMTLIEVTVVLLVLVAIAGIAVPYINGTGTKAQCEATDISMQNIKKTIVENYYVDMLGHYPKDTKDTQPNYNLTYLFQKPTDWDNYDSVTNVGWRGAYLDNGFTLSVNDIEQLDDSFKDKDLSIPENEKHVNENLAVGNTVILDAWGRPIILQVPTPEDCKSIMNLAENPEIGYCARLVSGGVGNGFGMGIMGNVEYCSNHTSPTKLDCESQGAMWIVEKRGKAAINTSLGNFDTTDLVNPLPINAANPRKNDDRILYLQAPTPASDLNMPCSEY